MLVPAQSNCTQKSFKSSFQQKMESVLKSVNVVSGQPEYCPIFHSPAISLFVGGVILLILYDILD